MKKLILLFSLVTASIFPSVAQDYEWAYTSGQASKSNVAAIRKDYDNNYYFATQRDTFVTHLYSDLEKRDDNRQMLWSKHLVGDVFISDVEINAANHAVVIGYYMDSVSIDGNTIINSGFSYSEFIFETDENGALLWLHDINVVNDEFKPIDLFIAQNGFMYITTELSGATNDFTSFHKLDLQGNIIKSEFNNNSEVRTYTHLLADNDGNVYLSGTCGNFAAFDTIVANINYSYQNFIIKYDSSFKALWFHSRNYITFDHNNSLQLNGNYLYWAYDDFTDNSDTVKIIKIDLNGNIDREIAGPIAQSFFPSIQFSMDPQGNSVLAFEIYSRLILFRNDPAFNLISQDTLLTRSSNFRRSSNIQCYDSSMYIAGLYYSDTMQIGAFTVINQNQSSNWPADLFVCKWSQSAFTSVIDLQKSENMLTIYPNPAINKISFNFDLKENENFIIRIFDNMGKNIIESEGNLKSIDVSSLSNGLYYLELISGKQMIRNRFIKQ